MYVKATCECDGIVCDMKEGRAYEVPSHVGLFLIQEDKAAQCTKEEFLGQLSRALPEVVVESRIITHQEKRRK